MEKVESIEDFYQRRFNNSPGFIRQDLGHFNVFRLEPFVGPHANPVPYKRRDYFKVMLLQGQGRVFYADKVFTVKKQALSFSNPLIPYKWENTDHISWGVFCIFNAQFFHQFGRLSQYEVFQPHGNHIFELSDEQFEKANQVFSRMFEEIKSDYVHKYDVLRNQVHELLHFAMKMQPSSAFFEQHPLNAAQRITTLFQELLERQLPIDESHTQVALRSASDFAQQLNLHVNHLNKAVKDITGKTSTQVIGERILQEAKVLLRHSPWSVGEIAHALGFKEVTHFNNFFKKHVLTSPLKFRAGKIVS
jgi:AraC family transcriptional regulator, transcriptional activator of pobA